MPTYDVTALDIALKEAGLAIHGCTASGRIDWVTPPTAQQQADADAILQAHDPNKRAADEAAFLALLKQVKTSALFDDVAYGNMTAAQWKDFSRTVLQRVVKKILKDIGENMP